MNLPQNKQINNKNATTTLTSNGVLFSQQNEQLANTKLNRVQNQISEVIDGVRTNVVKILDRGQKIEYLDERSEELTLSANLFQTRAKSTRKAMWLRTCRVCVAYFETIFKFLIFP